MQEYKILIPVKDNDGVTVDLEYIIAEALAQFGGYTLGPVHDGGWVNDNGTLYHDKISPMFIASDSIDAVRDLAVVVAVTANQECVYLRLPDGTVEFVQQ